MSEENPQISCRERRKADMASTSIGYNAGFFSISFPVSRCAFLKLRSWSSRWVTISLTGIGCLRTHDHVLYHAYRKTLKCLMNLLSAPAFDTENLGKEQVALNGRSTSICF